MSDILVQKYQHYFNESVKLQETVNEQLAYITELEDAIISLDEAYGSLSECIKGCPDMDIDLRQQCKAECAREFKEKQKGLDEMAMTADYKNKLYKRIKRGDDAAMQKYVHAMHSLKVYGEGGKVVGKVTGKYGDSATDLSGNSMGSVDAEGIVIPKGKKK